MSKTVMQQEMVVINQVTRNLSKLSPASRKRVLDFVANADLSPVDAPEAVELSGQGAPAAESLVDSVPL